MKSRSNSEPPAIRRARPWLGTLVEIKAGGGNETSLTSAVERAYAAVERVHQCMSFHQAESDVTRLNREASVRPVKVDPWTWRVLAQAQALFCASEGLFDITIAPLLMRWGYLPDLSDKRRRGESRIEGRGGDIDLLPGNRVRFAKRMAIDLGGIAKGFAADVAIAELRAGGAEWAVVNAGGDLRATGPQAQTVHVRHPDSPGQFVRLLELRNAALATSANYFTRKKWRGRHVSALIDPPAQRPCRFNGSVSVMAPTGMLADALTKIVLAGLEQSGPILAAFNAKAFLLTGDRTEPGGLGETHAL